MLVGATCFMCAFFAMAFCLMAKDAPTVQQAVAYGAGAICVALLFHVTVLAGQR